MKGMTSTPIACPLRVAAPPLKGQRLRPGKAGFTALPALGLARKDLSS
jgi:hypothetical protein